MTEPLKGAALWLFGAASVPTTSAGYGDDRLEEMIRAVIAEAKAEEREACAKEVSELAGICWDDRQYVAYQLRRQ